QTSRFLAAISRAFNCRMSTAGVSKGILECPLSVATKTPLPMLVVLPRGIFVATMFRMARPKKKATEAKTFMFRIRMTEAERLLLETAAKEKSLDTSTWARSELVALAKRLLRGK